MTDLGFTEAEHRHAGVVTTDQLEITVDVDLAPVDLLVIARESRKRLAHRVAEITFFAVVKNQSR